MIESPTSLYEREWAFNKEHQSAPPLLGVCFSGGGNRSAAFAVGVLRALHELGLLSKVDVISAVSGGSYALSWLLLQPFYHRACINDPKASLGMVQAEMFDVDGPFQRYLVDNAIPLGASGWVDLLAYVAIWLPMDLIAFNALRLLSAPFLLGGMAAETAARLNAGSGSRQGYREGIQHTYQVFPDSEEKAPAQSLTFSERVFEAYQFLALTREDVPPVAFPAMSAFAHRAGLPSFVFNTTVVPPRPRDKAPLVERVFELGSMGFGSDSCGYLAWEDTEKLGWEPGAPVEKEFLWKRLRSRLQQRYETTFVSSPYATIRNFNVAPAISGAALSGTSIESQKARWFFRLANLGLEYVVPSPADLRRIVRLSDGGHSENLGVYALLRRRCRTILVVDAEYDPCYKFGAYRKLKDAGVELDVPDVEKIINGSKFRADKPVMDGTTPYGEIFYLKLSMHEALLGDQTKIVKSYAETHEAFPQESTVNQYFGPDRFTAYRSLGYAIARAMKA